MSSISTRAASSSSRGRTSRRPRQPTTLAPSLPGSPGCPIRPSRSHKGRTRTGNPDARKGRYEMHNLNRNRWRAVGAVSLVGALALLAGCGGGSSSSPASANSGGATAGLTVPTAHLPVLQKIGKGEGQLNLIAWAGYLQPEWVKPFQ